MTSGIMDEKKKEEQPHPTSPQGEGEPDDIRHNGQKEERRTTPPNLPTRGGDNKHSPLWGEMERGLKWQMRMTYKAG
jgi:hypothetical protein